MPVSLRIPAEKEKLIQKFAKKAGTTKTAVILKAVDEKLGLTNTREQSIRDLAGWLSHDEATELRETLLTRDRHFRQVDQNEAMILNTN